MITHIQDITGATIQVPLASEAGADYVSISGQREEVEAATAMVDQLRSRIVDGSASSGVLDGPAGSSTTGGQAAPPSSTGTAAPHSATATPAALGSPPRSPQAATSPASPTATASPIHSPSSGITDLEVEAAEVILEVIAPEKFHRCVVLSLVASIT